MPKKLNIMKRRVWLVKLCNSRANMRGNSDVPTGNWGGMVCLSNGVHSIYCNGEIRPIAQKWSLFVNSEKAESH